MSDTPQLPDTQAAIDAGVALAHPAELDPAELYLSVLPAGGRSELLDLERYLSAPRRARGTVTVQTLEALGLYVERHDDPDATTIWVDIDGAKVVAVLDDHPAGQALWGEHRAVLALKQTPEWLHWRKNDRKLLAQADFAEHIEDGLLEIVDPDGATMLEVAQSIQGTTSANFKSTRRLDNGQIGAMYDEENTATAGRSGELAVPTQFTLAVAPFVGESPYRLTARLRWRIRSGDLLLGYSLDRPHAVELDALYGVAQKLRERFTDRRVFYGAPRSAPAT